MSAYVKKWTSTSSILHNHAKVSCLSRSLRTLGQPQGCSVSVSVYGHILEVCKHQRSGWAEAELAPLQKPSV